jgi:hypothetical protein
MMKASGLRKLADAWIRFPDRNYREANASRSPAVNLNEQPNF